MIYNRTIARAEALAGENVAVVRSAAEAAKGGVVLSIISSDAAVVDVLYGEAGLLEGLPRGGLHICCSTISVRLSEQLEELHVGRQQHYVAAPVLGRPPAAEKGELFIVTAGEAQEITRARPVFDALGQRVFIVSEQPSRANLVKLASNFMIYSTIEQFGEVFALCEKASLSNSTVFEVLTESFFGGRAHKNYGQAILDRAYVPPAANVFLGDKGLILEVAHALSVPMPFASILRDRFLACIASGNGDLDLCSMAERSLLDAGAKHTDLG